MSDEAKFSNGSWINLGLAGAVLTGVVALYSRVAVLETNSTHANDTLREIAVSVKTLADKQDGEREKIGNLDARVMSLEQWREEQRVRIAGGK